MLLAVRNISKSYGITTVLETISFVINDGDRIGLVGTNGVGKSVLLKILAREETADTGDIAYAPSIEIGYLPQATPDFYGQTIDDLLLESVGNLRQLEEKMRQLEFVMSKSAEDEIATVMEEYSDVTSKFQSRGGYELDHKIDVVMNGLELSHLPRDRDIETLSGGEKARIGLASLLLRAPDILLLDEPTNHLDFATVNWLESYINQHSGAVLYASHDRQFLNRTVKNVFEIDEYTHNLISYTGNYDDYVAAKEAARLKWEDDYKEQQEKLKSLKHYIKTTARTVGGYNHASKDNEKYFFNNKGNRAENAVVRAVKNAEEQIRRIEADSISKPPEPLNITPRFQTETLKADIAIRVSNLSKKFHERYVLHDINFALKSDAHVVIVGPNGVGKSTLLKIIEHLETPDQGEVYITNAARVGYLAQEPAFQDLNRTTLDAYSDGLEGGMEEFVAGLLRYGLFRYEDLSKLVGQLSLGQRRKLEISRLIAQRPNILLLDEPTNHISLDVLEAFEAAVKHFPGPVLAVSHDRWFIQHFGGEIWQINDGMLQQNIEFELP
ncbi:ribosomal protection-like ABC-F family protein [Dictyobacter kobayashii]|nr:ABC-F family ATP-binding cassette domain-containing protein [Dictyobacter kobayashii]